MEEKNNIIKYKDKIDLILPAFNEEESIKKCIKDFESLKLFKNIIVIDNNSSDKTKNEIKKTNAIYYNEKEQGYGAALIRGFRESSSDIIITCEPDLTFSHKDVNKFLEYIKDFDCVFGTRTSKSMIGAGAKMTSYLRYGNIFVAKILEYLFNGPCLTDVGCTYKAFRCKSINEIVNQLNVKGSHFQPELMINLIKKKNKIIEIPIFYLKRRGYSKITYNFHSSLRVALNMLSVIIITFLKNKLRF